MARGAMWGLLAVGILPAFSGAAWATVAPYTVDGNTLALWHFDETANPPTSYADATNTASRTLVQSTGSAGSLTSVAGLFGAGVSGFAPQGNTDNRYLTPSGGFGTIANPNTQTLEAWVKFDSPSALPQSQAVNAKQIVFRNSGSKTPLEFYFSNSGSNNALLAVTVKSSVDTDPLATITANLGAISSNTWYHIAYTLEQVGSDLNVKLYFQSEATGVAAPTPVAAQTLTSFTYLTSTYIMRIGEAGQTGSDPFMGVIDEMRLSNVARTTFSTFAIPEAASLSVLSLAFAGTLLLRRR